MSNMPKIVNEREFRKLKAIYENLANPKDSELEGIMCTKEYVEPESALSDITNFGTISCILCMTCNHYLENSGLIVESRNPISPIVCNHCMWALSNELSSHFHCKNENYIEIEKAKTVEELKSVLRKRISLMNEVIKTKEEQDAAEQTT